LVTHGSDSGNRQSGGKGLSGKITKGNARMLAVLIEVVWNLSRLI